MITIHNFHELFEPCLRHYDCEVPILDENILNHLNHFVKRGLYYGYPRCCIYDWVFRVILMKHSLKVSPEQYRAGECSGFLPCPTHAKQVMDKTIKLKDLICASRKCSQEFTFYARGAE